VRLHIPGLPTEGRSFGPSVLRRRSILPLTGFFLLLLGFSCLAGFAAEVSRQGGAGGEGRSQYG